MDLQEDTENGIPSSLQATFARLIAESVKFTEVL